MLTEIEAKVGTDFCMDMEMSMLSPEPNYTQEEAQHMAELLTQIYGIKDYRQGFIDGMKQAVKLFTTHEEGVGKYCDTGADMDWSCRSKCTEHGVMRCRRYYKEFLTPNLKEDKKN